VKSRVDRDKHGITIYRDCGLPVWGPNIGKKLAAAKSAEDLPADSRGRKRILLTTLPEVPGHAIVELLGLVSGVGHPASPVFTTTASRGALAHQGLSAI
jgi:hypothetical protein